MITVLTFFDFKFFALSYAIRQKFFSYIPKNGCKNSKIIFLLFQLANKSARQVSSPPKAINSLIAPQGERRSARFRFVTMRGPYTRILSACFENFLATKTQKNHQT